ncbi:dephospho-CoA kinase [Mucilaginibacter gynuensis]|uniref:Dephospho-CoA kinase n=1 Tax=Mucilaginibacter gynuensis TaxID=1302236 RepID=A0ABP8HJL4_9SPHI
MLKVGLTGNIGSGKTTVAQIFEVLGIPVFYSDTEAKAVMTTDAELIAGIKETFGEASYFEDGSLNRKHISGLVFNNPSELAKLNALVHPAVFRAFDARILQFEGKVPYIIKEAAILFESGSYKDCDATVLVTAPLETRIQRVMQRDNLQHDEVLNRDARQFLEAEKLKMANEVIVNDDSQLVIPQVLALHNKFLSLVKV